MAYPAPTKGFSQASPDTAMLSAPSGELTHLSMSYPFRSHRTYLPRYDMKLKVS